MDIRKYIDSVVGNIARKIEDEFNEADHPRDKGGKFTSKGNEGKGGSKEPSSATSKNSTKLPWDGSEEETAKLAKKYGVSYKLVSGPGKDPHQHIQLTGDQDKIKKFVVNEGFGGDEKEAKEWVPEIFGETETEKAAKEELASKNVDKLIGASMEGFIDDHELGLDFLKAMHVRTKDLYDEEGELDEEAYAERIEKAIRNNPEKAADNLEQLGDILYEEDGSNKETSRLKEIAADGFSEYPEMRKDFLKSMGVKLPKLSAEEREYYSEYPEEYDAMLQKKVEEAIETNPKAAKEALGEWADEN